ncbi:MAG: 50S ribosomal protein L33 [Lentisphaerae bacterium]|nr:50S ribosomal protein L33 [Lentisphaerota bacterium]
MPRELIILACKDCNRRNYSTTRNKTLSPNRLEVKKYCRHDRKRTVHREVK